MSKENIEMAVTDDIGFRMVGESKGHQRDHHPSTPATDFLRIRLTIRS